MKIKPNFGKQEDLRKRVLNENFKKHVVSVFNSNKKPNLSRNLLMSELSLAYYKRLKASKNPNFSLFKLNLHGKFKFALLWNCCNSYEIIYIDDLFSYKKMDKCKKCLDLLVETKQTDKSIVTEEPTSRTTIIEGPASSTAIIEEQAR